MDDTYDQERAELVVDEEDVGIERRMESAYIKCPCCGKHLQLHLVSDEEKGIVYKPLPDHDPGRVYLMREDH